MRSSSIALSLFLSATAVAQTNAIPGVDVTLYDVGGMTYYGRRGAAYPNGEIGVAVGHSFCNAGSVNIAWDGTANDGTMLDTYPKIAFLFVKEANGRMVQVSNWSHLKHSTGVFNFSSGPCAPCTGSGSNLMWVGCSDTYSTSWNSNRIRLGPASEINAWEGSVATVGSYFDQGDPSVGGAGATDNVKSLTSTMTSSFDAVKNRVICQEADLVGGGTFYAQVQAVIKGEPGTARHNNRQYKQCNFTPNGGNWSVGTTGGSSNGSVLNAWTGASVDRASNAMDDGFFTVASKVTQVSAGVYHYEYAVHNEDNSRAGATLRIPIAPGAVVTNVGFDDIDQNAGNDWTFSQTATEIVFSAGAGNALEYNTIYNFWFDCSEAPETGVVLIDQARPGAGASDVAVLADVPSGVPAATITDLGGSCGDCDSVIYELFTTTGFDLAGNSMTLTYTGGSYTASSGLGTYQTPTGSPLSLGDDSTTNVTLPFALPYPGGSTTDLEVCSNGYISPEGGNGADWTPTVGELLGGSPRWALAWHDLNPSNSASGDVLVDSSPAGVTITFDGVSNYSGGGPNTFQVQFLPNGTVHLFWQSMTLAGNDWIVGWCPGGGPDDPGATDLSMDLPASINLCATSQGGAVAMSSSARPVIGTSIDLTTSGIAAGSPFGAFIMSFGQALPAIPLDAIGMPGCVYHGAGPDLHVPFSNPGSSWSVTVPIPNVPEITGFGVVTQSFVYSPPLTPLGLVASNGLLLVLGQV